MIGNLTKSSLIAAPLAACALGGATAQDLRTLSKAGAYEDVRFELTNAIIHRGLVIDYTGRIGDMLARTGADVGSTRPLYKQAEFLAFCSARLSRAMMEADPANIGYCPYVVFIYESANKPGETVVGYRRPALHGSEASRKALAEIDLLLEGIIKDAVK